MRLCHGGREGWLVDGLRGLHGRKGSLRWDGYR